MLDKLRVCIICKYYSFNGTVNVEDYKNHPAVRKIRCEHLESTLKGSGGSSASLKSQEDDNSSDGLNDINGSTVQTTLPYKVKICAGNVSQYVTDSSTSNPSSKSDSNSNIMYRWMVYVSSPNMPKLDSYIKKVNFFLDPSFKPYDVVEVKKPKFQVKRFGWGEFPVHVQIHFKDARNKRVDLTHQLKLDWTKTGLQTFGGDTGLEVELFIRPSDFVPDRNGPKATEPDRSIQIEETKIDIVKQSSHSFNIDDWVIFMKYFP